LGKSARTLGLVGKLSLEELAVEASDVADAYALGAFVVMTMTENI